MQTKSCIEIVPLCHWSAPCCLGLAERTFGKDFTKYKVTVYFSPKITQIFSESYKIKIAYLRLSA
jgi:hypothetical protein